MSALTFTDSAAKHSKCRAQPNGGTHGYCHKAHNGAQETSKSRVTMHSVLPKLRSQPNVGLRTWLGLHRSPLKRFHLGKPMIACMRHQCSLLAQWSSYLVESMRLFSSPLSESLTFINQPPLYGSWLTCTAQLMSQKVQGQEVSQIAEHRGQPSAPPCTLTLEDSSVKLELTSVTSPDTGELTSLAACIAELRLLCLNVRIMTKGEELVTD